MADGHVDAGTSNGTARATGATGPADVLAAFIASLDSIAKVDQSAAALADPIVRAAAALDDCAPVLAKLRAELRSRKLELAAWSRAVKARRVENRDAEIRERQRQAKLRAASDPSGEAASRMHIEAHLQYSEKTGKPAPTHYNVNLVLAHDPRWKGVLSYHALRECVWCAKAPPWHEDEQPDGGAKAGEWAEEDDARLASWLSREWHIDAKKATIFESVNMRAKARVVDPPVEYFDQLVWDGKPRLDAWLIKHYGAEDTPYVRAVASRWMISIVARQYKPGCKADDVLILESLTQGKGKSSGVAMLMPDESWFSENALDAGNKENAQALRGKVLQEIGELSVMAKAEVRSLKGFVSTRVDHYRESYGRRAKDFPRRTIFVGTTNDIEYFSDVTGNRRFHPVAVSEDIDAKTVCTGIRKDRDQIWAEAVERYRAGEVWHIDTPELAAMCAEQADARRKQHPWESKVQEQLDRAMAVEHVDIDTCRCARCAGVLVYKVLADLGKDKVSDQTSADGDTMRGILRALGWSTRRGVQQRVGPGSGGRRERPYFPPPMPPPNPDDDGR